MNKIRDTYKYLKITIYLKKPLRKIKFKSKLKTGKNWTEERKPHHEELMRPYWANVKHLTSWNNGGVHSWPKRNKKNGVVRLKD